MCEKYVFKFYIATRTPRVEQLLEKMKKFLEEKVSHYYEISMICLMDDPSQAEVDDIFATPTLVRVRPKPNYRLIGDMSNIGRLIVESASP